jgi:hypothetical protein
MFIMGLVMLIAMPYFGGFHRSELKSEARRLASRTNYLYQEAGAQKVMLRLTFDLDHGVYSVTRLDPFAASPHFEPERGPAGGIVALPPGIKLRDVWVEGAGDFRRGTISAQFYPGGSADAALVHLIDNYGTILTIAINPYDGRSAIARGDLNLAQMASLR